MELEDPTVLQKKMPREMGLEIKENLRSEGTHRSPGIPTERKGMGAKGPPRNAL